MRLGLSDERHLRGLQDRPLVPRADAGHRRHRKEGPRASACRTTPAPSAQLKAMGFSDTRLADARRHSRGRGRARCATRSTCARSTSASTPAPPSSPRRPPTCTRPTRRPSPAASPTRRSPSDRKKVVILGGGPNRIGQGIEFDYCCCHACFALRDAGYETIMVNCNPETVSTDYDTSDRLYFEPLTEEDVIEILETEKQNGTLHGVIVQFGGQTPLKLADALEEAGVPILGTQPDSIDLAEDRDRFKRLLDKLELKQPKNGIAYSVEQARIVAERARPTRSSSARPTCSAAAPWRSSATRRCSSDYLLGTLPEPGAARHQGALSQRQDRPDQHGARQQPAAVRPLPVRRHRGRRRLPLRRQGRLHRRHHGAYRGSRHPFGRLAPARCRRARCRPRPSPSSKRQTTRAGAGAQGRRPDERAVRASRTASSTSSRSTRAPRAPCPSSPRSSASRSPRSRRASWRARASRASASSRAAARPCRRQGSGVPVRALPRRRHRARPGDALDRRGHRPRPLLRHRLRQEPARRRHQGAARRHGVRLGARRRQAAHPRRPCASWPISASRSSRPAAR